MPKDFDRTRRVASLIQRSLSQLIRDQIKDPRITGIITINQVIVSKDLSHAKVYLSILGCADDDIPGIVTHLNGAAGFLHNLLGRELTMRIIPKLKFYHDTLLSDANRIHKLIDDVIDTESAQEDGDADT